MLILFFDDEGKWSFVIYDMSRLGLSVNKCSNIKPRYLTVNSQTMMVKTMEIEMSIQTFITSKIILRHK